MLSKNQIAELIPSEERYIYKAKINWNWVDCDKKRYNRSDKNKRMRIDRAKHYFEILNFISKAVIMHAIIEDDVITIQYPNGKIRLNTYAYPDEVTSEIIGIIKSKLT